MDVKALAKSKRAHTQHHSKKPHHNQKLKTPPSSSSSPGSNDAVGTANKPLGKQQLNERTTHRSSRSHGSSGLPTNWDRYEEEGSEGVSPETARKTSDIVLPKSKGADFRHLVAEAQSQAETSLEDVPSLDDLLPGEFNVGLSSMLAVRGEGILSWIGDDNFVVEDKTTGNQEASFISLNLHALAESLEKVDLSKRLFIESDLLPTELRVDDLAVSEEPDKLETSEDSELANRMSKELNLDDFATDQFASSSSPSSSHSASAFTSTNDFPIPVNYVDVEIQQAGSSGKHKAFLPSAEANFHSTEDTRRKHSAFEVAAAEKELDMLLDSPSEAKILDSPGFKPNTSFPVSLGVSSVNPPQISNEEPVPSKTTASLDDALDDLLEETSTLMNPNALLRPQEENYVQSSSHSGSKSKVSDDFDSWFDTL